MPELTRNKVVTAFTNTFGRPPAVVCRAPGRVNLLGAHVDYNEGWVLPAAIDRAVWLAAAPAVGPAVTVRALDFDEQAAFVLAEQRPLVLPPPAWLHYPMGVAWALRQAGYEPIGLEAVLASDVPIGAGVSSSAAVEMAFVLAWDFLAGWRLDGLTRARVGQQAENGYLGVGSGIMDQFASVFGAANHVVLLDCRSLAHELIELPGETAVLLVDSGVRRELAKINYNARPDQCRQALAILQTQLPHLRALRDLSLTDYALYSHWLPPELRRRVRHVVEECDRVLRGADALRQGNLVAFGELIRQSQLSSRDHYEVSIPELDLLAATAWPVPGCYGSRFGGGGSGGFMQVLAEKTAVDAICQTMTTTFARVYDRWPTTYLCQIAAGAAVVWPQSGL